jgi:threonine/homoserine/homoserine lactone efflux protein
MGHRAWCLSVTGEAIVTAVLAAAAIVFVAAVTPGPNNVAVLRAARAGVGAALASIAGVVLGSLGLLTLAAGGVGSLLGDHPGARSALAVAGCAYLAWLGARLAVSAGPERTDAETEHSAHDAGPPVGFVGLLAFQLVNPKAWVLTLSAVAAVAPGRSPLALWLTLAPVFVVVPAACLLLWALGGALLGRSVLTPQGERRIDRALGAALFVSALLLLVEAWP